MASPTKASRAHVALLEQAVNRYAPRLWAPVSRELLRWLRSTLAAIRPQLESLVVESRATAPKLEVIFLQSLIEELSVLSPPPDLSGAFADIALQVALQYGFLRDDPRREVIIEQTVRLLRSETLTWWRNLTDAETLARRIWALREEGLGYTAMARTLASTYRSSFYSAERVVRTTYNSAANNAALQDLLRAGYTHKRWLSSRDNRVRRARRGSRFDHAEADGQVRPIEEPFIVSGERLMFPGDVSLGASRGNVIHCRCVVVGV